MLNIISYILIVLSIVCLIVSLVIRKDFEKLGGVFGVLAIILFVVAICILAFNGPAPHIVDDQYMPVSHP